MALSNPLEISKRAPGFVGMPLPSVHVAVCAVPDDDDEESPKQESSKQTRGATSNFSTDPRMHPHVAVAAGESGVRYCHYYCHHCCCYCIIIVDIIVDTYDE
jgi:hypothetical protein